ncbi:MAG: efflux RND transporter periplasmic adaptor subunit [Myxococcota bacterium]|nr:efflux RND transporter periplasmic adaptor subunit [Myxococcota bacterium]
MRFVLTSVVLLVACKEDAKPPAARPTGPTEVGVVTITPQAITLTKELPGRTSAVRVAEVRARVNGIVQQRMFAEGSDVKAGQPLFRIDPAPYQAALDSARAQVAKAEASVSATKSLADRYTQLIESKAVSQQEYDDAIARFRSAQADVAAARAAVKTASINLGFTTVTAPLAGRIGRAEVTEGAYVQQTGATLLATIQQLDRVYVDLTWSSSEAFRLRRAIESGEVTSEAGQAKVTLVLEDGRDYGTLGTMQFTDVTVDPTTGSISLRAVFPNAKRELLPGMFVRARIEEGTKADALLVPQKGVTRDQTGRATAMVVTPANKVERRQLVTDRAIGDAWLVTDGIKPGDQVVVEGLQKIRPGADVKPVPAKGPEREAVAPGSPGVPPPVPAAPPPTPVKAAPAAAATSAPSTTATTTPEATR